MKKILVVLMFTLVLFISGCSVSDTEKPVISGLDSKEVTYNQGDPMPNWLEGVTAKDNIDGNLTSNISVVSEVNMRVAGSYLVLYSVVDKAGNTANETLTITVTPVPGIRYNPVELGNSFTISGNDLVYGDYKVEVTVNNITRGQDAENIVLDENTFNEASGDSKEYLITNITVKLLETDTAKEFYQNYGFDNWYNFRIVTSEGKMYNSLYASVIPNDLDQCTLYIGNSCTGNIVNLIDNNEEILIKYNTTWFKTSTEEINFTIPEDENPNPDYGTQTTPVPLGESQVVDVSNLFQQFKIKVKINSITRGQDAENIVINENMYNEPSGDTKEYMIVNYIVTLISTDESQDFYKSYGYYPSTNISFVSTSSGTYPSTITVIPNDIDNYSLFLGGTASGNSVQLINEGDDVLIKIGNTWFSLE